MKYLFTTIILSLLLFSCKKEPLSFSIIGQVNDATFSSTTENANVKLYSFLVGSSTGVFEGNTTTNTNGEYSFELERDKYEKIQIVVEKDLYFKVIDDISFSDLSAEHDNTYNYALKAKSWTKFIIKNQQQVSENDEFKLFKNSGKTDCDECCQNGYSFYYGDVDTAVYCANNGNQYMSFFYWVNGNEDNGNDSIYNTPFDTITYELMY